MKTGWIRPLAGLCAAAVLAAAGQAVAAPAMYAVRDEDSTIYLFGTVHLTSADTSWRTPIYDKAYAESGEVWLEADVFSNPEELAATMAAKGVDKAGRLETRLGQDDFAKVVAALKPLGLNAEVAKHLEPWFAAVMIMAANLTAGGMQAETGAEQTSATAAKADNKTMRYLEAVSDQIDMLAGLSEAMQVQFLREALLVGPQAPEMVAGITEAWVAGDETALFEQVVLTMKRDQPEVYEALLRRRNLAWAEILDAEMKGSGVDLVTVGAAHMLGDDGLPALLRAKGYTVERVQ